MKIHILSTDLARASDEALALLQQVILPVQYPLKITFWCFAVVDGYGYQFKNPAVTLHSAPSVDSLVQAIESLKERILAKVRIDYVGLDHGNYEIKKMCMQMEKPSRRHCPCCICKRNRFKKRRSNSMYVRVLKNALHRKS